jgi:hypothetical protein
VKVVAGLATRLRPDEGLTLPSGSVAGWRETRSQLNQRREARRQQRRFRRAPLTYLQKLEELADQLGSTGRPGPRVGVLTPPALPSARKLSYDFIRRPAERAAEAQARLDKLRGCEPALQESLDLAGELAEMFRRRGRTPLAEWLAKAEGSGCAELRGFARGLRRDEAAVAAALTERWSNGPVEGAVNRLKLIKRSMYGRAGWELLRARVRQVG